MALADPPDPTSPAAALPEFRYDAALADKIELAWQDLWETSGIYHTASTPTSADKSQKLFIMDMFPYPSGAGLHVGHPLGFIGTDVYARFKRMCGFHVLHTMGYDAFGLPAEEHARQTGEHPRVNTERNIANMSRQLRRLGLGHDSRRSFATTDEDYYRWTQWIFLQIYNSWYDQAADRARPIAELIAEFETDQRPTSNGTPWQELDKQQRHQELNQHRLAYLAEAQVNWCPGLGTVLANEEITAEGRSERGDHKVFRRPLKQWMMRITEYADRLLEDLNRLDWPNSVKLMQRNWIGRSEGAHIRFPVAAPGTDPADPVSPTAGELAIEVFTTRPDTIYGTTAMVLAPEHPLVSQLTADAWPAGTPAAWKGEAATSAQAATPAEAVKAYQATAGSLSEFERQGEREKTGIYLGSNCIVPVNGAEIPIFIADYVLMGYGTGAVMSVPGEDQRDWDFAKKYGIDIVRTVETPSDFDGEAYSGEGPTINSDFLDGMSIDEAKQTIIAWLTSNDYGEPKITYKLRDWLFSRQRYWGEPFPIVFDEDGLAQAVPEEQLPVQLPELIDWAPRSLDEHAEPEPPLGRAEQWVAAKYDLGDGERTYQRELNTMPNWAGSCWYYLRYLDPDNPQQLVDPEIERYWMADPDAADPDAADPDGADPSSNGNADAVGGVDLYVGGVEHAVLHLLYARFWHKVLYDLGHVSGPEPFRRLYNQGYILAAAYQDDRGVYVDAEKVAEADGKYFTDSAPDKALHRSFGKMGKSLRNAVAPDDIYASYGADTLRLYEMFMGPLNQDRPWETRSVIGSHRLLQRVWRNLVDERTGQISVVDEEPDADLLRLLHQTIAAVTEAMDDLRFNSAIARISELNNELTAQAKPVPRSVADVLVRLLAPLVPHMAEQLWAMLHGVGVPNVLGAAAGTAAAADSTAASPGAALTPANSVVYAPFPQADKKWLTADTVEIPIQINGKVRSRMTVATDANQDDLQSAALANERIRELVGDSEVKRVISVPAKLVNVVLATSKGE